MQDTKLFTPPKTEKTGLSGIRALMRDPLSAWPETLYNGKPLYFELGHVRSIDTPQPDDVATVLLHQKDAFKRSTMVKAMMAPAMGDGLIIADGESWRMQRSAAAPVFRQSELDKLVPIFDKAARRLTANFPVGQVHKVLPPLTDTTLEIITASLFGDVDFERAAVAKDVAHFLKVGGNPHVFDVLGAPAWVPRPGRRSSNAAAKRFRAASARILADKRKGGGGGGSMTDRLIAAIDPETGSPLTDEQIVDAIVTFVGAGHETTSVALSWTLWLLAHRPDLQRQLAVEGQGVTGPVDAHDIAKLGLHTRVFQEAMRLYPPVISVLRTVASPVTVGGKPLRRGDMVNLVTIAMHRNPDIWPDPDTFDPDRFLPNAVRARHRFAYLPFGGGATMCIGWKLALMEGTVLLHRLIQDFEVQPVKNAPPPYPEVRITMRPDNDMPLIFTARHVAGR